MKMNLICYKATLPIIVVDLKPMKYELVFKISGIFSLLNTLCGPSILGTKLINISCAMTHTIRVTQFE